MWLDAREELGEPSALGSERREGAHADDTVRVIAEQVGTIRWQVCLLDDTAGIVVGKVAPDKAVSRP